MASGGRAFLVGLVALVVSIGIILGVELLSFNLKYNEVEICGKARLLCQKPVDETRAKAIARVIRERDFYDGESGVDIFLQDDDSRYKLTFILGDISQASTPDLIRGFNEFESVLNFNLNFKKHIDIFFVDSYLNNEVELQSLPSDEFKKPFRYLYDSRRRGFFFGNLVNLDDVKKIKKSLSKLYKVRIANLPICLIYVYSDTGYMLKFCVDKKYWDDSNTTQQVKYVVERLRSGGFTREVNVVLYDFQNQREQKVDI